MPYLMTYRIFSGSSKPRAFKFSLVRAFSDVGIAGWHVEQLPRNVRLPFFHHASCLSSSAGVVWRRCNSSGDTGCAASSSGSAANAGICQPTTATAHTAPTTIIRFWENPRMSAPPALASWMCAILCSSLPAAPIQLALLALPAFARLSGPASCSVARAEQKTKLRNLEASASNSKACTCLLLNGLAQATVFWLQRAIKTA
mmetsp:Transcript_55780/g.103186  ORF Transcript_55780/g.103186 Transcript_55780/m.103186 type:complete len:201 (+) Transcript_55780:212-814(+)